jgi:hypothetical protein
MNPKIGCEFRIGVKYLGTTHKIVENGYKVPNKEKGEKKKETIKKFENYLKNAFKEKENEEEYEKILQEVKRELNKLNIKE